MIELYKKKKKIVFFSSLYSIIQPAAYSLIPQRAWDQGTREAYEWATAER